MKKIGKSSASKNLLTVKEAIEYLKQFPDDAFVGAYEGESVGITVEDATGKNMGFVETVKDVWLPVEFYEKNTQGRDFIVGDIHARYDELMQSLSDIGFDFGCDRLFSVGDLIDRGTQNKQVVELVDEDWFIPVRGNHDQMIIDQFEDEQVLQYGYRGKTPVEIHTGLEGQWFAELSQDEKQWFYDKLKDLPFLINLKTERGNVGICHAGLPRYFNDWWALLDQLVYRNIQEQVLRTRRAPKQQAFVKNTDITVHGHTCFEAIHQLNNSFWIDTFDKTGKHTVIEVESLFDRVNADNG